MSPLQRRLLFLLPAGVSFMVLWWLTDPTQAQFADLRIMLLEALQPMATDFHVPDAVLPFVLYPLVALNIAAPVLGLAFMRHNRSLLAHLSGGNVLLRSWPVIQDRHQANGVETVRWIADPQHGPSQWLWLFLVCIFAFALSLWCRDQWRVQASETQVIYTIFLELILLIVWSRMLWWWVRMFLRARLLNHRQPTYLAGGWLLRPQSVADDGVRTFEAERLMV